MININFIGEVGIACVLRKRTVVLAFVTCILLIKLC